MPVEIERRFLVDSAHLPRPLPPGDRLVQGYLCFDPLVRVRIVRPARKKSVYALITVKGRGLRVRAEYEYPIPARDGSALMKLCGGRTVEKHRIRLGPWLLDRFHGRHAGLWIAEFEQHRARQALPTRRPPWLGREVTEDPRYTNARLARLKRWRGRAKIKAGVRARGLHYKKALDSDTGTCSR